MINEQGKIYEFVSPDCAAYHAGFSFWSKTRNVNNSSIGVEIVNLGAFHEGVNIKPIGWIKSLDQQLWQPFLKIQIDTVISLTQKLIKQYNIPQRNIVGHMDVAPYRKIDPGYAFPWKKLSQHGVGAWPDMHKPIIGIEYPREPSVSWMAKHLGLYGYDVSEVSILDAATQRVFKAFQMHFDSDTQHFGQANTQSQEKLARLLDQYPPS